MGSFDEKIKLAPVLEIEAGELTVIKIMYKGMCIKEEVISVEFLEWNPIKNTSTIKYNDLTFLKSIK